MSKRKQPEMHEVRKKHKTEKEYLFSTLAAVQQYEILDFLDDEVDQRCVKLLFPTSLEKYQMVFSKSVVVPTPTGEVTIELTPSGHELSGDFDDLKKIRDEFKKNTNDCTVPKQRSFQVHDVEAFSFGGGAKNVAILTMCGKLILYGMNLAHDGKLRTESIDQVRYVKGGYYGLAYIRKNNTVSWMGSVDDREKYTFFNESTMTNVEKLFTNGDWSNTWLALKKDGTIETWGEKKNGADLGPKLMRKLKNRKVVAVKSPSYGPKFMLLLDDGTVLNWGNSKRGGNRNIIQRNVKLIFCDSDFNGCVTHANEIRVWGKRSWQRFISQDVVKVYCHYLGSYICHVLCVLTNQKNMIILDIKTGEEVRTVSFVDGMAAANKKLYLKSGLNWKEYHLIFDDLFEM